MGQEQEDIELGALPAVQRIAGISKSEIFRRVSARTFPSPIKLGPRCTRWNLPEVRAWVAVRLAQRQAA